MLNDYSVNLFVYGSLRKGESNHWWLGDAEFLGQTESRNAQLYDLGSYPMMVPGEGIVRGELYRIPHSS